MAFYYSTDFEYKIGAVLPKGRWGSMVNQYGYPYFEHEKLLEEVRVKEKLSSVSRLDCFFAFSSVEGIEGYHLSNKKKFIYEVEPVEKEFNNHFCNYEVFTFIRTINPANLPFQVHAIALYWLNEKNFYSPISNSFRYIPEILIGCDVRITKIL